MKSSLVILALLLVGACSSKKKIQPEEANICKASQEFITTMEYLRAQKEFALTEKQIYELSDNVSKGCTGAAGRFVKVTDLMITAGFTANKSIETATYYALKNEESFDAFVTIFKSSYLESLLDLNLEQSLKIAKELSESSLGTKKNAEKEFTKLVDFCVDQKTFGVPLMDCATISARVVKSAEKFEFNVANDFIEVFSFLTNSNKANIPSFKALPIAENIVKHGPLAKKSFLDGYDYAISKKGLDKTVPDAIKFGELMASRSEKI
jgi:hypothetical protein